MDVDQQSELTSAVLGAARLAPHIHYDMLSGLRVITGKEISVQSTWHCVCAI